MWGEIALEKVSETPDGQEWFVIAFASEAAKPVPCTTLDSGRMTEEAIWRVFSRAGRTLADMHAMLRVARQVFAAKTKLAKSAR